jgi:hypothetical protein
MSKYDDLAAASNALNQAAHHNANTPVDVNDPASVERKQATGRAAGTAAKDFLNAWAAAKRDDNHR